MVSVSVSKLGQTHLIFVDPGIKINGAYYRDVLLKQDMLPVQFLATSSFFSRTMHRPIGSVRRSRYCSERFRLSLFPICGLPTAQTSTLLTTRCGVRCRTVFIGRRCETLTIWNSVWLTCGTVWSKAPSTTRSTSGVHDFVPVSVRKGTFRTVFVTCIWTSS